MTRQVERIAKTSHRKTGITLQDKGIRDEHGMEPLDGIFSSPEKSPAKTDKRNGNVTLSSEEMLVAQSTRSSTPPIKGSVLTDTVALGSAPDPLEVLTGRRSTLGKGYFPPPASRSPIKTAIGSSPRRQSVGPSPSRTLAQQPHRKSRGGSFPAVSRRLDFSANDEPILTSIEESPGRQKVVSRNESNKRPRKDVFALRESPEQDGANVDEEELPEVNGYDDDNYMQGPQDDSLQLVDQEEDIDATAQDEEEAEVAPKSKTPPRKSGRPKRNSKGRASLVQDTQEPEESSRKRQRAPADDDNDSDQQDTYLPELEAEVEEEPEVPEAFPEAAPPPKRRGRPPRNQPKAVKDAAPKATKATATKSSKEEFKKPLKPAPSQRGPNAKIVSAKRRKSEDGSPIKIVAPTSPEKRKTEPRSLQILRQGTPAQEGSRTTRAGRASVAPLAWWAGERAERDYDGTIKSIVRAESVEPEKRARAASRRPTTRKKRAISVIEEEEEEEDIEDWELDPGRIVGITRLWDPEQGVAIEDPENEIGAYSRALALFS